MDRLTIPDKLWDEFVDMWYKEYPMVTPRRIDVESFLKFQQTKFTNIDYTGSRRK